MPDPINLAKVRVDRSLDSRDWSVRDALQFAIDQIDSGEIDPKMVYVAMMSKEEKREGRDEATVFYDHVCAGCTNLESAGLLAIHPHKTGESM